MYRVRVDRERPFVRQGTPMTLVEFTLEKAETLDGESEAVWRGLVSGANECPATTSGAERDALLLAWAREIAPDGATL